MHELGIFLFALTVRFAYFFKTGAIHGGDTSFYFSFADLITQNGTLFNIPGHPFYYSLYPLLIVLFQKKEIILVAIQILIAATATVALYRIGKSIFNKKVGVIAALLYSISWELFQWDVYVLTDSLAVSFMIFAFYFLIQLLDKRSLFNY